MKRDIDLYVVVERSVFESDAAWLEALSQLAALEVPGLGLQVRLKDEPQPRYEILAAEALRATAGACAPVLLNGSSAEAERLGYGGAHWPEALIPARADTGHLLRGASVHSTEACRRAEQAGAGFLVAGTIFDAGSKPARGTGLGALRTMAVVTSLPVLAIGGITPERVASCLHAGAAGVAVVSSVLRAPDMRQAAGALREALDEAHVAAGSA